MSDEESFVILGSSPMSSLENEGLEARNTSTVSSLQSDTPCGGFTSLKDSQIIELRNAQETATQTPNVHPIQPEMAEAIERSPMKSQTAIPNIKTSIEILGSENEQQAIADSKLWSRSPQMQDEENIMPYSLEKYALKSPLEQKQEAKEKNGKMESSLDQESSQETCKFTSTIKTTPLSSVDSNLATGFIMGEVNSDVLKTSVYSQFPSISMEACAEDVMKLQNMVTEYTQLKATIKKANNTMKQFYNNSVQWKQKMKTMEEEYKQQLDNCKAEFEELRKQYKEMENNFKTQIEAIEVARKKDREENVKEMSEKNALLENMRAQIIKLEQQQLTSFKFVDQKLDDEQNIQLGKALMTHREHELKIKDLQRELSEMLAANLSLKDIEKNYIDELNCLKVNLAAAEELIKKNHAEICQLTALNIKNQEQMETLENCLKSLRTEYEEQKERIVLLETQNEVHRTDFEMEKESRETAVTEKQRILQDLRSLQKANQKLIEEHLKMADDLQKRSSAAPSINETKITAASVAAQTYFNNPQIPIRVSDVLPSPSSSAAEPPIAKHMCPICNKAFKSLSILLSHVNDCVDKN